MGGTGARAQENKQRRRNLRWIPGLRRSDCEKKRDTCWVTGANQDGTMNLPSHCSATRATRSEPSCVRQSRKKGAQVILLITKRGTEDRTIQRLGKLRRQGAGEHDNSTLSRWCANSTSTPTRVPATSHTREASVPQADARFCFCPGEVHMAGMLAR